jgi:hypothetical protein
MPTAKQFKIGDVVKLTPQHLSHNNCPKKLEAFKDGDLFVMECLDGDKSITVRPFGEQKILGPFFSWRFDLVKSLGTPEWPIGRIVKIKDNYPHFKQLFGRYFIIKGETAVSTGLTLHLSIIGASPIQYTPKTGWKVEWLELMPEDFVVPEDTLPDLEEDGPTDEEFEDAVNACAPDPENNKPITWKYNPDTKEKTLIDPATLPKPEEWQVADFALIIEGAYTGWIAEVVQLHPTNLKVLCLTIKNDKGLIQNIWYQKDQVKKVPKPTILLAVGDANTPYYIIIRVCPTGTAVGSTLPKIHTSFGEAYTEAKKLALENPGHKFHVMKSLDCYTAKLEGVDVPVPA